MKLDIDKVIESMKIEDEVTREIIAPLLKELNTGEIYYSYDTDTRISSLKTKIREKIKDDFLKKIAG